MLYSLRAIHNSSLQMNKYLTSPCCSQIQHRSRSRCLYVYICTQTIWNRSSNSSSTSIDNNETNMVKRAKNGMKILAFYEIASGCCCKMAVFTYRHFQSNEIFYLSLMFIPSFPHQFMCFRMCCCTQSVSLSLCVYSSMPFTIGIREFNSVEFMQLNLTEGCFDEVIRHSFNQNVDILVRCTVHESLA